MATAGYYLAGNPVYGYGSSAATSGTVDPMGYIERELEKKQQQYQGGSDGESDTRSGLAQSALQANGNDAASQQQSQGPIPEAMDLGTAQQQFYSLIGAAPDGSLQYPQLDLPFDPDIANERVSEIGQYNQTNLQLAQQLQQAAQQRLLQQRSLDDYKPKAFRQLVNNFAGRGMAFSSGYGEGVSETNRDIANQQYDIDTGFQRNQQDIQNQGLNNKLSFIQRLQQLASSQSERAAARAAELALAAEQRAWQERQQPAIPQRAGGSDSGMSRAAFLKAHPVLASLHGEARQKFLRNHPGIAKGWEKAKARG